MKLLITTQAVDIDDPILGFFHLWLEAFAQTYECVHVICLREGAHALPKNVHVHSLGKEVGENRLKYIARFFRLAYSLRDEYDAIFSHMNPHYIVLAGWFWKLTRKNMFFWRNHAKMNLMTRIAAAYAHNVFYTSPFACTRIFRHAIQMPVGIDTSRFMPQQDVVRKPHTVLFLGRLSRVKRPELFARACALLRGFEVHSYGSPAPGEEEYTETLRTISGGRVILHESVPNYETPKIYSAFELYVNLTPEGSMDKTVFEAAACGALVLVTNRSFIGMVPDECIIHGDTPEVIAEAVSRMGMLPSTRKEELRMMLQHTVEEQHSLRALVEKLTAVIV